MPMDMNKITDYLMLLSQIRYIDKFSKVLSYIIIRVFKSTCIFQ